MPRAVLFVKRAGQVMSPGIIALKTMVKIASSVLAASSTVCQESIAAGQVRSGDEGEVGTSSWRG